MATLVRFHIDDPQDIIDAYGTGALARIERGTSATMGDASEIGTKGVVPGTTEYEFQDIPGVAGTHWYRIRYSTTTPASAFQYSDYGPVFQAGAPGGEVIALEAGKRYLGIPSTDTDDDGWLPYTVGAINRVFVREVGIDIGPSPDTTRTYDACEAVNDGRRLWIPGGIRAFTTVEVSYDGSTWTDVTSSVRVGPLAHSRTAGEPGAYIEVIPYPTTFWSFAGWTHVRITGTAFATFGWDAYPMDAVQACLAALQRAYADRQGRGQFPTETDILRYFNPATLAYFRRMYFAGVR